MDNSGEKYFAGIDPGATGGIGIIDNRGGFVAAHRWNSRDPRRLYDILLYIGDKVGVIYIEMINAHPGEGLGHVVRNQALVENSGIWQGMMIAAGLPFVLVHPATWQAATGLRSWQAKQKINPAAPSPLSRARQLWPAAPLPCLVDDGKAVALLLADLARRDSLTGFDRAAAQAQVQAKAKAKKVQLRKARKAQNALASDIGW